MAHLKMIHPTKDPNKIFFGEKKKKENDSSLEKTRLKGMGDGQDYQFAYPKELPESINTTQ